MQARYHVLSGSIAASLLLPILGINSIFFFASSVLIDGDHYLDYIYRNGFKDFSIKGMFNFHRRLFPMESARNFLAFNVAHTAEALLLVYAAGAISGWVWLQAVFWGMLFHIVSDLVYLYHQGKLFRRPISIIEYIIRWQRMKRHGMHPEIPYQSALRSISVMPSLAEDKEGQANQQD
ncbi:MAG: hypothetical protein Q8O16_01845 [Dehalococcoidia bacterium]|nr:hypothetical protein [Dehalococcoidia bacterium]